MTKPPTLKLIEPPPLKSRSGFLAAVNWSVRAAIATDSRQMGWIDADFADWPLNDAALLQSLGVWLQMPQRKLVLLARNYTLASRVHPRFVTWRRHWGHAIDPRALPEEEGADPPTWLLVGHHAYVELFDRVHWRGHVALEPKRTHVLAHQFDALAQRSSPDFPVTNLGL